MAVCAQLDLTECPFICIGYIALSALRRSPGCQRHSVSAANHMCRTKRPCAPYKWHPDGCAGFLGYETYTFSPDPQVGSSQFASFEEEKNPSERYIPGTLLYTLMRGDVPLSERHAAHSMPHLHCIPLSNTSANPGFPERLD